MIDALDYLRKNGMGDCLNLLHFHLGSQINNIRNDQGRPPSSWCASTWRCNGWGRGLKYMDVGGGLGRRLRRQSKTDFGSSMNYGVQEYANDIIFHVKEICDAAEGRPPDRSSARAGRAMVAYHSVLVFNVLGLERVRPVRPAAAAMTA